MIPDYGWVIDHLVPSETDDNPEMFTCPAHGGGSLHVTKQNGKALLHCFGCGAKPADIIKAMEDQEDTDSEQSLRITFTKKSEPDADVTPSVTAGHANPLAWLAKYCDVDEAWLRAEVPVRATPEGWVEYYWTTSKVTRQRQPNGEGRRQVPPKRPRPLLWPTLPDTLPPEIWLVEGETDCIVLRSIGLPAYTAGSATDSLTADDMKYLRQRGVERLVVAYDSDPAGRKGGKSTLSAAKECGLGVSTAVVCDPLIGGPKDWRERHVAGDKSVPETTARLAAQEVHMLKDVPPAETTNLLLGKLHPDDHTILFGDGGTGKGVIAAWWVAKMSRGLDIDHPMNVLIVDYEEHARHEWRPRVERFRGDLERVYIYQPQEPIWDEAASILSMCEELGIDYVVVDSVTYACVGSEAEKSVTATMYSDAVKQWRKPTLSLAHTTKVELDPKHPFGSVYWSNGARITICVSVTGGFDSPRKLELKKANQGGEHRPTEIEWGWVAKGTGVDSLPEDGLKEADTKDIQTDIRVVLALTVLGGEADLKSVTREVNADGGEPMSGFTVRNHLSKLLAAGKATRPGRGIWKLAEA